MAGVYDNTGTAQRQSKKQAVPIWFIKCALTEPWQLTLKYPDPRLQEIIPPIPPILQSVNEPNEALDRTLTKTSVMTVLVHTNRIPRTQKSQKPFIPMGARPKILPRKPIGTTQDLDRLTTPQATLA